MSIIRERIRSRTLQDVSNELKLHDFNPNTFSLEDAKEIVRKAIEVENDGIDKSSELWTTSFTIFYNAITQQVEALKESEKIVSSDLIETLCSESDNLDESSNFLNILALGRIFMLSNMEDITGLLYLNEFGESSKLFHGEGRNPRIEMMYMANISEFWNNYSIPKKLAT